MAPTSRAHDGEDSVPPPLPRFPSFVDEERDEKKSKRPVSRHRPILRAVEGTNSEEPTRPRAYPTSTGRILIALPDPDETGDVGGDSVVEERTNVDPVSRRGSTPRRSGAQRYITTAAGDLSGRIDASPFIDALRNDESVIAEAVAFRRTPIQRLVDGVSTVGRWLHAFFVEDLPSRMQLILHPSRRARQVGRMSTSLSQSLDRMQPNVRRAIIAAPYILAGLVGLVIIAVLASGSDEPPARDPIPEPKVAAAVAPPPPPVVDEKPTPEPELAPVPQRDVRTLPVASSLYTRPTLKAKRATRLRAGTELEIFAGVPAPAGWVVAKSPLGTLGYITEARFTAEPKPVMRRSKKRRRVKRRKRRRRRSRLARMPRWP